MLKGDIVLVNFPFTDLSSSKYRPAVVLGTMDRDVTVCFITTQIHYQSAIDILIIANKRNGLKKTSLVRVNKMATLDRLLLKGLLGKINISEISRLNKSLISFFDLKVSL